MPSLLRMRRSYLVSLLPKSTAIDNSQSFPHQETIRTKICRWRRVATEVGPGYRPSTSVRGLSPFSPVEITFNLLTRSLFQISKTATFAGLEKASASAHAHPPTYLPISQLSSLQPAKFGVILIDPSFSLPFSWTDLQELPIPALSADPSFVLLWVGSGAGDGMERGREVLAR